MCGRYALSMRPSQVREYLEGRDLPVADVPGDEAADAPRRSYNLAPGQYGAVYRADVSDHGARPEEPHAPSRPTEQADERAGSGEREAGAPSSADVVAGETKSRADYKLQAMKWGLIPSWTKRNPGYGSLIKTINCRSESLAGTGGLWSSMKARKRCVVVADGFYEWLKVGPKEKVPHYVKRKDGGPMLFAGLWDCVQFEDSGEKLYTYTIITVPSTTQLSFLHDRMPAILDPSAADVGTWLDPSRTSWSPDLQDLLRPSSAGLEVYPVSKEVGKVGNDSPSFVIPVASRENKGNIANFFANARKGGVKVPSMKAGAGKTEDDDKSEVIREEEDAPEAAKKNGDEPDVIWEEAEAPSAGSKRGAPPADTDAQPRSKVPATSPMKSSRLNATRNGSKAHGPQGKEGSQKITKFFTKAA